MARVLQPQGRHDVARPHEKLMLLDLEIHPSSIFGPEQKGSRGGKKGLRERGRRAGVEQWDGGSAGDRQKKNKDRAAGEEEKGARPGREFSCLEIT